MHPRHPGCCMHRRLSEGRHLVVLFIHSQLQKMGFYGNFFMILTLNSENKDVRKTNELQNWNLHCKKH